MCVVVGVCESPDCLAYPCWHILTHCLPIAAHTKTNESRGEARQKCSRQWQKFKGSFKPLAPWALGVGSWTLDFGA